MLALASSSLVCSPFQKVYAFFGANVYQQANNTEYELENPGILTIENIQGNITITTETNQKKVYVSAIKKVNDEKLFSTLRIKSLTKKENELDHIILKTHCEENATGEVDYSLIVPQGITLQLTTQQGDITVGSSHGPLHLSTLSGAITIHKANNTIKAEAQKGDITITDATGNISATAYQGDITINGSHKSVLAQTEKGAISMRCAQLPQTSRIELKANAGNIKLSLPENINAAIYGLTEKGTLISDALIEIKPRVTKLNRKAWKQFTQEVDGTIGTGEAEIKVLTTKGNIKIAQTKDA